MFALELGTYVLRKTDELVLNEWPLLINWISTYLENDKIYPTNQRMESKLINILISAYAIQASIRLYRNIIGKHWQNSDR